MSLQARFSPNDDRLYSTNRDLAHCFGPVMSLVLERVRTLDWPALVKLAKDQGVTDDDLGKGCKALTDFVASSSDLPKESMAQGLARCGWFGLPDAVRVILMAHLGTVILGMHWGGVREATLGGVGPALGLRELRWLGRQSALLMKLPWWRRKLLLAWRRVRRAWAALWDDSKL